MISQGGVPSSAWTMLAWLGMTWSALELPQARQAMSSGEMPKLRQRSRIASAVSRALVWVTAPVAGSMA